MLHHVSALQAQVAAHRIFIIRKSSLSTDNIKTKTSFKISAQHLSGLNQVAPLPAQASLAQTKQNKPKKQKTNRKPTKQFILIMLA